MSAKSSVATSVCSGAVRDKRSLIFSDCLDAALVRADSASLATAERKLTAPPIPAPARVPNTKSWFNPSIASLPELILEITFSIEDCAASSAASVRVPIPNDLNPWFGA